METGLMIPQVTNDLKVDKDDVIAVGVAMEEEALNNEIKVQSEICGLISKKITDLHTKQETERSNSVKNKVVVNAIDEITEALSKVGFKKTKVSAEVAAEVTPAARGHQVTLSLCEKEDSSYRCVTADKAIVVPWSSEYTARVKELGEENKKLSGARDLLNKARRGLANLASTERKARARFAIHSLEQTVQGQALLNTMKRASVQRQLGS